MSVMPIMSVVIMNDDDDNIIFPVHPSIPPIIVIHSPSHSDDIISHIAPSYPHL